MCGLRMGRLAAVTGWNLLLLTNWPTDPKNREKVKMINIRCVWCTVSGKMRPGDVILLSCKTFKGVQSLVHASW
jgi:hypothetical protein